MGVLFLFSTFNNSTFPTGKASRLANQTMTFTFLLFVTRKPTITPAEFKFHWNPTHVEVIKSSVGEAFPSPHPPRYIARPAEVDGTWPSAVLVGTQEDFTYDG